MILVKWLIFLVAFVCVNAELNEVEEVYLKFFIQLENVKKSVDILKSQVEAMKNGNSVNCNQGGHASGLSSYEERQRARNFSKPVFDVRIDRLPAHCENDELPSNCAKATECTETSGYYNISVSRYRGDSFYAFCDYRTLGGDWLHILRRLDGSQNFTRNWWDYVYGFGKVEGEYWIGLENLYALTNFDGPQELFVYMENHTGHSRYARYDHFQIGGVEENYVLKSVGKYSGNAGNSLEFSVGANFSTFDMDSDTHKSNCALIHKGGWWYKNCAKAIPTGFYHPGNYKGQYADGIYWKDWMDLWHSMKTFVMMIRRQRIFLN